MILEGRLNLIPIRLHTSSIGRRASGDNPKIPISSAAKSGCSILVEVSASEASSFCIPSAVFATILEGSSAESETPGA